MTDEKDEVGFRIVDKRTSAKPEEEIKTEKSHEEKVEEKKEAEQDVGKKTYELSQPDFATLILMLSSTALIHLGEAPDPASGKASKNIEEARYIIDIISMLKDKTEGNRTEGESKLIENMLYDLRMRFVNAFES